MGISVDAETGVASSKYTDFLVSKVENKEFSEQLKFLEGSLILNKV
jgi:hypothetical protein